MQKQLELSVFMAWKNSIAILRPSAFIILFLLAMNTLVKFLRILSQPAFLPLLALPIMLFLLRFIVPLPWLFLRAGCIAMSFGVWIFVLCLAARPSADIKNSKYVGSFLLICGRVVASMAVVFFALAWLARLPVIYILFSALRIGLLPICMCILFVLDTRKIGLSCLLMARMLWYNLPFFIIFELWSLLIQIALASLFFRGIEWMSVAAFFGWQFFLSFIFPLPVVAFCVVLYTKWMHEQVGVYYATY